METAEVRQLVEDLSGSVWAFSALSYAAETGLLVLLAEPRTVQYLSEHTGVPAGLCERICDVLNSLNLVQRRGDAVNADRGLVPLLASPARDFFLSSLRATYLESKHLVETAKDPASTIGWSFTDPAVLQAQGMVSAAGSDGAMRAFGASLEGLPQRLQSPSAKALDIGVGVGALSIALCRALPNIHVIGIDNHDAPLDQARRNVAAAGLADRIELRKQGIEDMNDVEAFDFVFFPQMFMPDDVVKRGLENVLRALRPGAWAVVPAVYAPGDTLQAAQYRLMDTLFGGTARTPSQVHAMMVAAGFSSTAVLDIPASKMAKAVAGRRPTRTSN